MGPDSHPQEGESKPARDRQRWAKGTSAASLSSLLLSHSESWESSKICVRERDGGLFLSISQHSWGNGQDRQGTQEPPALSEALTEVLSRSKGSGGREPDAPRLRHPRGVGPQLVIQPLGLPTVFPLRARGTGDINRSQWGSAGRREEEMLIRLRDRKSAATS